MKSALLVVSAAAFLMAANIHSVQPRGLTIHEWGTFTSVAGEDGSAIDWDALGCKSDLPQFVNDYGFRGFKWRLHGTVRMETPVMYFYSSREVNANVKVSFPSGLITEWYPKAEYTVFQGGRRIEQNLNGIDTSLRTLTGAIEWRDIKVQPDTSPDLPLEKAANHYYAARQTDSAPITVGLQHEKFLFYRGVGRFPVPLWARVSDDAKIAVENRGREPLPIVILFENRGGQLGYRTIGGVHNPITLDAPPLNGSLSMLRAELETALIAQGLFPKEAHAMVETWRDSWFEEGSRLIYIVPQPALDAILPLEVEPAPSQAIRVFVGRIELITPEIKHSVESAIAKNDWPALDRYSHFLDPILQRVYAENPEKVGEAEQLFRNYQAASGRGVCR